MKKLTLLFTSLFAFLTMFAGEVTEAEALQKAQQFMQGKQFQQKNLRRAPLKNVESKAYYVFNADNNGGFVIIAGDDRMPEILGYADHGNIDLQTAPCGLKWLLSGYEQMAKNIAANKSQPVRRAAKASIAPFVSTTWGQTTPYNTMCPNVNGAKSLTGCVATAMAQIMNYYRWPNVVTEPIPAYTTSTNNVSMPQLEPTTFTWGHLNKNQLSKLMLYCGQSVQMDYGPKESGAGVPYEALKNFFGYDENLRFIIRDEHSDEEWDNILYEEILALRPVYYFGFDDKSGHAFIICGYNDNHFYINWGWDGGADGYFVLDGISPSVGAYNLGQGAVIGIIPKGEPSPVTCYPRRTVMEDKAWRSNGEYILGIETIKRLKEEYPDNFIAIETHVAGGLELEDPENYSYMEQKYGGSPCCWINRLAYLGSNYSDVKNIVETNKNNAYALIEASAVYAKPDKSAITVKAKSTFGFNGTDEDFRFAFVLLEDHVGPYIQDNSFYSNPQAPDNPDDWLNDWIHKDAQVEMMFDDVARGIYGDAQGIESSIPTSIEKDKTYYYEYTFNVPVSKWDWASFNNENFRVVALLIDKSTGEIMNACQTKILYDESVNNLSFEYRNQGKGLYSGEALRWKSKGKAEDHLTLGTNIETDGLKICTFNKSRASGTATLEILSNTLSPSSLTWAMSGELVQLTDNSKTISFTTDTNGELEVQLTANDIQQYGELEAKLTTTINGASQYVIIKFVHKQSEAQYGADINGVYASGVEIAEGQSWWENGDRNYMQGTEKEERYSAATFIPAHLFGDKVPTIGGVSFFASTSGMKNIEVWISTHLPVNGEKADIATYSFPDDELVLETNNSIVFNREYEIPGDGVYVGYSFDIVDMNTFRSATPIVFSEKTRDNALWFKTESMTEWTDRFGDMQGNLNLRILFGGDAMKKNAVSISPIPPVYSLTNTITEIPLKLYNEGSQETTSITIDGDFGKIEIPICLRPNGSFNSSISFDVGSTAEFRQGKIRITEVNGQPNESEKNIEEVELFISHQKSPTTVVLEEFTATWCGYSTQADLVMEELRKEFRDSLITICVHGSSTESNDPMQIPEYNDIRTLSGGAYPSLVINRQGNAMNDAWTPFFNCDIDLFTKEVYSYIMPGYIKVGAVWDNEAKDAIKIQTRTTFELNATELPFQISYVLLEDGMSGEGIEWAQSNIYSGIEDIYDRRLEELTKLPALIYGYKYNNVPVAAWDAYKGVKGSLVGPFKAGVPIEGSFLASIKDNTLIQNKENLSVVALIVNKETGKIINAAKCKIGDTLPIIITPVTEDQEVSFDKKITEETDLSNTVIDNTYFNMDADNGDGFDATEKALVLNSTTTATQMSAIQDSEVGDAAIQEKYKGVIFEIAAGKGIITVDAKTIGTHVLNVQVGNNAPTKVTKTVRGTVDIPYSVTEPTYVYLYASTAEGSAARLNRAPSAGENSVLLYGYKVTLMDIVPGDADGDTKVDVNDVTSTINYILNKPVATFIFKAADMDQDGKIDVNDVQAIIYKALGK